MSIAHDILLSLVNGGKKGRRFFDFPNGATTDDPTATPHYTPDQFAPERRDAPEASGSDDGVIPVEDRMRAVIEAAGASDTAPPPSTPAPAPSPRPRSAELVDEYERNRATKPHHTHPRIVEMLLNMAAQAGEGADMALRSGRPVDEYALAGAAGQRVWWVRSRRL